MIALNIVVVIAIVLTVMWSHRRLPSAVEIGDLRDPQFSEQRALELARRVTHSDGAVRNIGYTRHATDIVLAAVRALLDELCPAATASVHCDVRLQEDDGTAFYTRAAAYLNYAAVTNVIVTVEPRETAGESGEEGMRRGAVCCSA